MEREERFEQQYPVNAREKEIKQILEFVTRGQSCQLISVPGAGRSTILRLLAYHKKLREHHLASKRALQAPFQSYLFVYVNFAELPSFETVELNKALFLAILSAIRESDDKQLATLGREIYAIFKEAVSVGDPQVLFQQLKRAIQLCSHSKYSLVFLFDRFSEFADKVQPEFFTHLRALRQASGGKLAVVFSTHKPLEELVGNNDFYEYYAGNHVFLEMYDSAATDFRIGVIEKEYNKKLNSKTKEELIKITGGHGKLVKLATQIVLRLDLVGREARDLRGRLLNDALIKSSLFEIFQAGQEEVKIPLFSEFLKLKLYETFVPKTIRFNQETNEIYFGDDPVCAGLTAQEFRLLKFLISNPNRICERDEVIEAVWTDTKTAAGVSDEALDQMIHRVRRKIEDEADNPKHLLTIKGRGFRFIQ